MYNIVIWIVLSFINFDFVHSNKVNKFALKMNSSSSFIDEINYGWYRIKDRFLNDKNESNVDS